jgi:hypothetical protein
LKEALVSHTTLIDAGFTDVVIGRYKGTYIPESDMLPSWKEPRLFWLDNNMPYEKRVLRDGVSIESFSMVTGTTLSYWLSPALTGAYRLSQYTTVRGMIQLAVMAVWQKSFEHYYLVTEKMIRKHSAGLAPGGAILDKYPLLTYCDTLPRLFSIQGTLVESETDLIGGDYYSTPPRYSPITFNIRGVFGRDRGKVDSLVDALISLINAVNEISVEMEENGLLLEPCRTVLNPLLNTTRDQIRAIDPNCDFEPFRLLLFLHFCAHLNLGLKACKKLRNLLYPVSGDASHGGIVDGGFKKGDDSQVDEICSFLQSEMSTVAGRVVFMDEIEPMLCLAFPSERSWEGKDIFIKGQLLFRLDDNGTPWVKSYEKILTWSVVREKKDY